MVVGGPTDYSSFPTQVEVELACDNEAVTNNLLGRLKRLMCQLWDKSICFVLQIEEG